MTRAAWSIFPDEDVPSDVVSLARQIEQDGGKALAIYEDPVGRHWQVFAMLPREKVAPTPYQRDLSKTHAKRLTDVIRKLGRFIDPVVAVRAAGGGYWTPNGNHRRAALETLRADWIPAIVIPEEEVAFQILALNTEKAHNLKEKSLEVIRMLRGLIEADSTKQEKSYAFQFEEPSFITLGILYERHPRFAGGAYNPILRRVDAFLAQPLRGALKAREKRADLVERCDETLAGIVAALAKRGIKHPYVKNFVLARTSPLRRARKDLPDFETALEKLRKNLDAFDVASVKLTDISGAAASAEP
ncbi:MAG: ParB N-terminal domain-containing protein [Planctomycetes bacterium]|nr:ParB N-terminal domain-containing protein [Planctomycetota bacterium]